MVDVAEQRARLGTLGAVLVDVAREPGHLLSELHGTGHHKVLKGLPRIGRLLGELLCGDALRQVGHNLWLVILIVLLALALRRRLLFLGGLLLSGDSHNLSLRRGFVGHLEHV